MDEFVARQLSQMRAKIAEFRGGGLKLNGLVQQLEGLARAVDESFWADSVFPLVFDLERINSELMDKRRDMSLEERQKVESIVASIELIARNKLQSTNNPPLKNPD